MTLRSARLALLAALCAGVLVPLQHAGAACGLAPNPVYPHKHVRTGDLTGPVRLYGDSITFQVWKRVAERDPDIGVDAFWGRRTKATVNAVLEDAEVKAPSLVLIAIGTNDTRDPSDMAEEVRRARENLPSTTRVLWVNTYVETNDGWTDVDAAIATTPGVEVVDWALENLRAKGLAAKSPLLSDGVHLSCRGGDVWVDLVDRALDRSRSPHHMTSMGPSVAMGDFRRGHIALRTGLPASQLPYARTTPLPLDGEGLVDKHGVRLVRVRGKAYDDPGAQAEYGLALLESYRLTGKARYLELARAQADRLVLRRTAAAGAWFYPYPYELRGPGGVVHHAPWYSGLAQGQALSLLTRLATVTHDPGYLAASHLTFASLLVPPSLSTPWVSRVSEDQLWVEQYPAGTTGARTLTGHVYATFGLYDYWLANPVPLAETMLQGSLTTALDAARRVRIPGRVSKDGTVYAGSSIEGHTTRVGQLLELQAVTGLPAFARLADLLHTDAPDPSDAGRVVLVAGSLSGFRFDPRGNQLESRTVRLEQPTVVASSKRVRVRGYKETWLELSDGPLTGYLVRESPSTAYRVGVAGVLYYPVDRTATVVDRTRLLYRPASSGRVASYDVDLRPGDRLTIDRSGVLAGVPMLRVSTELHRTWWVPAAAVRLD